MRKLKFLAFVAALMIAAACSEPLDEAAEVSPPMNEGVADQEKQVVFSPED